MKRLNELLQEADPLQQEGMCPKDKRDFVRQRVLAGASDARETAGGRSRLRVVVYALAGVAVFVASLLALQLWSPLVSHLQAAVRFEIRLAGNTPAPGLRLMKVSGSERSIYLYPDPIVTNGDVASSRVTEGDSSHYGVEVVFTTSGADKMRGASAKHIGKPVAIVIDGQVVAVPTLRSPISGSAVVSGNFSRAEAERIANGIK